MIEQQATDGGGLNLDYLEALNTLRTQGEWSTDADSDNPPNVIYDQDGEVLTYYKPGQADGESWGGFESADDARFVVAMANAAPKLLAELRRPRTLEAAGLQAFVDRISGDDAGELAKERAGAAALRAGIEGACRTRRWEDVYRAREASGAGASWLNWAQDALALIQDHLQSDDECRCTEAFFRGDSTERCTRCRGQAIVKRAKQLRIASQDDQTVQPEPPSPKDINDVLQRLESLEQTSCLLVKVSRGQLAMYLALERIASADNDMVLHSRTATSMRDIAQRAIGEISGTGRHYLAFIASFAGRMESLLYANDATTGQFGWRGCKPTDLLPKLREEIAELVEAAGGGDPEQIANDAADVANICAMIADVAGAGESEIEPSEHPTAPERPTIVCLCGSTRFWRAFQAASLRETLAGRIVLSIGAASGTDDDHFGNLPRAEYDRVKAQLDELHLRKIDLADEVLILNVGGYLGDSTRRELAYAQSLGKRIRWLEEPQIGGADAHTD